MHRPRSFHAGWFTAALLLIFVSACEEPVPSPADITDDVAPQMHGGDDPIDSGSHFRFGTLNWRPTGTPGEVRFQLKAAFRRTAYPANFGRCVGSCPDNFPVVGDRFFEAQGATGFNFGDGSPNTGTLWFEATGFDASGNWVIGEALMSQNAPSPGLVHTYAAGGPYNARLERPGGFDTCCRIGAFSSPQGLANRASEQYRLSTTVRPLAGNSSPVSGQLPIVFVPESPTAAFFVSAGDPDGDGLTWRLATNAEAGGGSPPPNISIDAGTGQVTWNNVGLTKTRFWTVQFIVEDGQTETPVDFLLQIVVGNPPVFVPPTPPDGSVFNIFVGDAFTFDVQADDPDLGQTVTLNNSGLPGSASFTSNGPANPVSGTFSWTPGLADAGSHVITFAATDNTGLTSTPRSYTINVIPNRPPDADAGPDQTVECMADPNQGGTAVMLDGTGSSDPDGDPLTYEWRDAGGNVVGTGPTPTVHLGEGVHTITLEVSDGKASDTDDVVITVEDTTPPNVALSVTPDELWPPNHKYVAISVGASFSDACDDDASLALSGSVVSSEPDDANGNGDGHHTADIRVTQPDGTVLESSNANPVVPFNPATDQLEVRSERAGGGPGRTYTITFTAEDGSGNAATATATVFVPHDQKP